jgi:hypothetical protein
VNEHVHELVAGPSQPAFCTQLAPVSWRAGLVCCNDVVSFCSRI